MAAMPQMQQSSRNETSTRRLLKQAPHCSKHMKKLKRSRQHTKSCKPTQLGLRSNPSLYWSIRKSMLCCCNQKCTDCNSWRAQDRHLLGASAHVLNLICLHQYQHQQAGTTRKHDGQHEARQRTSSSASFWCIASKSACSCASLAWRASSLLLRYSATCNAVL